jgi:hypothetical protein
MTASRERYFAKLTEHFPDDNKTMRFYTRDYIAPRFAKTALAELITGVNWNDQRGIQRSYQQVMRFSAPLLPTRRLLFRAVALVLSFRFVQAIFRAIPRRLLQRVRAVYLTWAAP